MPVTLYANANIAGRKLHVPYVLHFRNKADYRKFAKKVGVTAVKLTPAGRMGFAARKLWKRITPQQKRDLAVAGVGAGGLLVAMETENLPLALGSSLTIVGGMAGRYYYKGLKGAMARRKVK